MVDKVFLKRLDVVSNNICNFRCANCSAYCAQQPIPKHYQVEDIIEPLKHIQTYADIDRLYIYGGEPTLHPDIENFVRTLKQNIDDSTTLEMITNGWWMPNEDKFRHIWRLLDTLGQGIHPELLQRLSLDQIRHCMSVIRNKYKIATALYIDPSFALYGFTDIPLQKASTKCRFDKCTMLMPNGELSRCGILCNVPRKITSEIFHKTRVQTYFDVATGNAETLSEWLETPPECCQYCTGDAMFVPHFSHETQHTQERHDKLI
jgi:hypothetical protein